MAVSVASQLYLLALSVATGAVIGVLYDLARAVRRRAARPAVGAVCDVLFSLAAAGVFFLQVMQSGGELRIVGILGAALGCALYLVSLSRLVLPALEGLLWLLGLLCALLALPLRLLARGTGIFCVRAKKYLETRRKRYRIRKNIRSALFAAAGSPAEGGGTDDEKEKENQRHPAEDRPGGDRGLRYRHHHHASGEDP